MTTNITTPATDAPAGQEAVREDTAPAAPASADREPRRTRPGVPALLARRLRSAGRATTAPAAPEAPAAPDAPAAPAAPAASAAPAAPEASAAPKAPKAPKAPEAPKAPAAPVVPDVPSTGPEVAPAAPVAPEAAAPPEAPAVPDAPAAGPEAAPVPKAVSAPGAGHAPSAVRKAAAALGRRLRAAALRSAALVALLALWETAPRLGLVDATFLPPVSEVATAWWDLLGNGQLGQHTRASLARSFGGFGIAVVIAVPLGLLIGWYRPVAALLGPLLEVFRNTAALALLPVFVLLLGIGETSKVSIVVYACLWPVLLNTISAVGNADPTLVRLARSMDLSTPRLFQKVILPSSVPAIFTGIRLAGAVSILVLVAAEMIGAKAGLGYLINASQYNFAIPQMYAGIVTISAVGVAFNQLLVTIERRLSTWRVPA
ncbi:ABC transporter permease [Streptomyces sp. NPDC001584]|uniref:ABC transporter permease n=1 Tax=Streptomyces sp. NPDC001584 TaxID=3154521 RepID=UPI0033317A82